MGKPEIIPDRASMASLASMTKVSGNDGSNEMYNKIDTPVDIEGGALRAGGKPNLYSRDSLGLLCQYAAVGIIYGTFPRTVYPFLNNYLNLDGYQTTAAQQLVSLPWSFKTFIGMVTDSFPIMGFRRRPYMLIGWASCFVFLVVMASLPIEDPFYLDYHDRSSRTDLISDIGNMTCLGRANFDSTYSGSKYILMMMFASFGYVVADVAADGMVVEYAQREPESSRGETQTTIYMVRFLFQVLSSAMVGFFLNGHDYGGSFSWTLNFNELMIILSVCCCLVIPATLFLLKEEKHQRESFVKRLHEMWEIIQQRAIWQIMAYKFFSGICSNFSAAPISIIQREWAHVEPLNDSIATILAYLILSATLYIVKTWGLGWSWRWVMIVTVVSAVSVDVVVSLLTVFDVVRNEWFFLGVPLVNEFPEGVRFIISTYVVVEVASEGHEGMTYGLLTTISNLSIPFSGSIYKNINAYFDVFKDDIKSDTDHVRWQAAYCYIIMYSMNLGALLWLPLLPNQKKDAQALKRNGGSSFVGGLLAIIVACFALIWSVTTNLMSIFESTACYKVAGGEGCKS